MNLPIKAQRQEHAKIKKYVHQGKTWIPRNTVKQECGIDNDTADRWEKKGILKFRSEKEFGPYHVVFRWKEEIDNVIKVRAERPLNIRRQRSTDELRRLAPSDLITIDEMESMGVKYKWAVEHWDRKDRRRRKTATPTLAGELIKTKTFDGLEGSANSRGFLQGEILVYWNSIKTVTELRDNPPVPNGGVLLRDAIKELQKSGIMISRAHLYDLWRRKLLGGGCIKCYKKNLAVAELPWMEWEKRSQIARYEKPGKRMYWIGDPAVDHYPLLEAWHYARCRDQNVLAQWIEGNRLAKKPCPYTRSTKHVRWIEHPIKHKAGDSLRIFNGEDLRDIAEGLTGERPKAPKPPRSSADQAAPAAVPTAVAPPALAPTNRDIPARRKRRGRRNLASVEVQRRNTLLSAWREAREVNVSRKAFVADNLHELGARNVPQGIDVLKKWQSWKIMTKKHAK